MAQTSKDLDATAETSASNWNVRKAIYLCTRRGDAQVYTAHSAPFYQVQVHDGSRRRSNVRCLSLQGPSGRVEMPLSRPTAEPANAVVRLIDGSR